MSEHHQPRKRFGQNFLIDNNVINRIVQALHPQPNQHLVEIGAGLGALTKQVLEHTTHLHVIEIDNDLSAKLIRDYAKEQLSVHQADALQFDFDTLYEPGHKLRIFGNLPYNISTPLLFYLLHYAHIIEDMLFMLQKEVVVRMAAKPNSKDYGRLSIMLQYHCQVQSLFEVQPKSFSPPPKVTSAMVRLIPYGDNRPHPVAKNEKVFAQLVTTAFSHRRKTLKNALNGMVAPEIFEQLQIDAIRRPETLSIAEFIALSDAVNTPSR